MPESALLAIDLQVAFMAEAYQPRGVLDVLSNLTARARSVGAPVIWVREDGEPGSDTPVGTAEWELHPALSPRPDDVFVHKTGVDSFDRTGLDGVLREHGVRRLVIAGYATEYCVDTACRVALHRGYDVHLVADGHTTVRRDRMGLEPPAPLGDEALAIRYSTFVLGSLATTRATCTSVTGRNIVF